MKLGNDFKPLSGIKVVELGVFVAAPACTRALSDLGADVVKIESPVGDAWRAIGLSSGLPANDQENPLFDIYNAGKKGAVINLKSEAGMAVLHRLLSEADIFITNNRPAALKKLGIDYDSLKEKYPRLIYGSISGFGDYGPESKKPGFDNVCYWSSTGFACDQRYTENPFTLNPPSGVGDTVTGYVLLSGVLAALHAREKTGKGEHVSTSLYGTGIWVHGCMIIATQKKYGREKLISRYDAPPFGSPFRCSDGEYIQVTILDHDRYIKSFYEAIGRPDMAEDPRFVPYANARQHFRELNEIFIPIFEQHTSEEMLKELESRDIACSRMTHYREVTESEQAWANDYLEHVTQRNGEDVIMPANPLLINSDRSPRGLLAPRRGEHTRQVLADLGYTQEQIDEMIQSGAVGSYES